MATDKTNDLVHIIDKDGNFIPVEELKDHFGCWDFTQKAFSYYVVAILGAQSSGKSTLLNLLFGTTFPTLEAHQGRRQTTQGIWLGLSTFKSEKHESILVFDVEGVDGRERGEKEASFERKTSLFSLALSEVLIVNMWHTDVGRYNAGNIALLKTVFEQHLQLFGKSSSNKTLIMFLIRDHLEQETPLPRITDIIMQDMHKIWGELTKPAEFQNSKVEDFFQFMFASLPHKVLAQQQFNEQIEVLRKRFTDPKSNEFVLTSQFKKDVPADGFAPYASRIWQTIKENKDLDLPSQKEMLAMFRCDEIMEVTLRDFNQSITPIRSTLEKGLVEDFGKKISDIFTNCVASYDTPASRYHEEVAARKRNQLENSMTTELQNLFSKQLLRLIEKTMTFFEKLVKEGIPNDGTACKDFAGLASTIEKSTIEYYESRASGSILKGSDWSYQSEFDDLKTNINKQIAQLREKELQKLLEEMRGFMNSAISKQLDKVLESPPTDLWDKVRTIYASAKQKGNDSLQERIKGFNAEEDEAAAKLEELNTIAFEVLRDKFKNKAKYIQFILSKKFEENFSLDENGIPRRWKPGDDIKQVFTDSRQKSLQLLDTFAFLRIDPAYDDIKFLTTDEDIDDKLIIIPLEEAIQIKDKFEKESNSTYLQALRDQENVMGAGNIPMYIIILILVLGFNEIIWLLTNPLLLILFIMMGAGGYVLYMLNMLGPAKAIMETLLHSSLQTLTHYVNEQMAKTPAATAPPQSPSSRSDDNKKDN